jgi:RNase adaptor protein for sRNA GlmZ degradation
LEKASNRRLRGVTFFKEALKGFRPTKKIIFYSFGHNLAFKDCYPKPPRNYNIRQFVFDVRDLVNEIWDGEIPDSGLKKRTRSRIIKMIDENGYYEPFKKMILGMLHDLVLKSKWDEKKEIRIFFGCHGGWQRSVSLAKHFKDLCQEEIVKSCYADLVKVEVHHLTLGREHGK